MARGRRSSSGYRGGKRKKSGTPTWLLVSGAGVALLLLVGLVVVQNRTETAMAIDPDTLCPSPSGPVARTAILFDLTDPLSPVQVQKLKQYMEREFSNAAVGTQFTMGIVSDDPSDWGATSALCKPRSGEDVSQLTQNVKLVQQRYDERFLTPMHDNMRAMMDASGASASPIMEALQSLIASSAGYLTGTSPRKLIVVSDLLQHSDNMSFYRGDSWSSFAASPAFRQLSPGLNDVAVEIYGVPRTVSRVRNLDLIEDFWVRYFDHQGARLPMLHRLGDL